MEFIKKMKKREFIEMGLKTLAAVLAAFLAVILMEGMIYSINLNAYKTVATTRTIIGGKTIAYCIEVEEDQYFVLCYNEGNDDPWSATKDSFLTKQECLDLANKELRASQGAPAVKEVVFHAPNAFEFSITGVHYIVITLFMSAVAGFFVWRFIALSNAYKKIEEQYKKDGTIELGVQKGVV